MLKIILRLLGSVFRSRRALVLENLALRHQLYVLQRPRSSIRLRIRECLDHVVIVNEKHLRQVLREYVSYYSDARTHLALGKDAPELRAIEPPEAGRVVALPRVGGLHHRYTRRAA